jgi:hypothetical protein
MNLQEKMPGQANKNFIKHTYGKLWLLIGLLVFNPLPSPSQKITLDPQKTFQWKFWIGKNYGKIQWWY